MNNTNKTIMTMSEEELRTIKSDEYCTLKQLFEGEKENDKIIIPDLQRDYCWGTTADLVSDFIDNIINLAKEKASEEQIMGLLYGYTTELAPRHIQLCDGQQRLTTLFLLIGMLNRRLDNKYQQVLISDFEFSRDDQEPHLQYSIRESSLYFLSDLTCQFLLNDKEDYPVEDISNQSWFLNSYHLDPTIRSILAALKTIDGKLNDTDVDLKNLAEFVLNKLKFLYYDMENRHNGEETFVLINTTGEPLSSVQNQKPKFIQANHQAIPDVSKKWEDMETWFWQNRNKKQKPVHTADEGMQVFFSIIENYLGVKPNDGEEVFAYFDAYKRIYETNFSERHDENVNYEKSQNKFLFALLPTLKYCYKFKDAEDNDLKRIYHLFFNQTRFRLDYTKVDDVIPQIDLMPNKSIDSLLDIDNKIGDEENRKLKILSKLDPAIRLETELLFAEAESNKILSGRLSILLDWSDNDLQKFKSYWERFKSIFKEENQDLLLRALLAKDAKFSWVENLKRFETLLDESSQWYKLLKENSDIFQELCAQDDSLKNTIENYNNDSLSRYLIIKDKQYLQDSTKKLVYIYHDANVAIVMNKRNVNAGYKFICNGKNFDPKFLPSNWKTLWCWQSIIFSDHKKSDVSIDVIVKERNFCITLLTDKNRWNAKFDLEKFATEENRNLQRYNDGSARYIYHSTSSVDEAFEKMKELAELVDEFIEKSK